MASVHETVRSVIFNYPMLAENRTQVLHRLFVMFGNGYKWEAGELVNSYPEPDLTDAEVVYTIDGSVKSALELAAAHSDAGREFADSYYADMAIQNETYLATRRNADRLAVTAGPLQCHVYVPVPDYAYLFNAPKDITADWHAARIEIAAFVQPLWQAGDHLLGIPEKDRAQVGAANVLDAKSAQLVARLADEHTLGASA